MDVTGHASLRALPPEARELLEMASYGYLALAAGDDGLPLAVPVCFALLDGDVVFHGAPDGEKMRALARDDRSTLSVAEAYSLIPSSFGGGTDACAASQYFVSVQLRGRARVVEEPAEKAAALTALMAKLEPKGVYRPIEPDDPAYAGSIARTAVVRLVVERASARVKLGQSLAPERRSAILERLAERGQPLDLRTVAAMRRAAGG